jgi:hypothetical protein
MQAATSPTQNIGSVELNWLKSGTHNLPGCHGSITLTENMLGLGENDIPQALMKEFPDATTIKAIIFVKQKADIATIFVSNTDTEILNDPQKINGNSLLKTIKDSVEKNTFLRKMMGKITYDGSPNRHYKKQQKLLMPFFNMMITTNLLFIQ